MRVVSIHYLREANKLLKEKKHVLSNKRLRRLAYLDVYQNHYQLYGLYNNYKRIVNSDAANNQLMVLLIVVGLISAVALFFII